MNFVLIKFSLLLFEKSWNECKNPSFLHKAMCIESDHCSTKMRHCLSTFVVLYSRRLWSMSRISFEKLLISKQNGKLFLLMWTHCPLFYFICTYSSHYTTHIQYNHAKIFTFNNLTLKITPVNAWVTCLQECRKVNIAFLCKNHNKRSLGSRVSQTSPKFFVFTRLNIIGDFRKQSIPFFNFWRTRNSSGSCLYPCS